MKHQSPRSSRRRLSKVRSWYTLALFYFVSSDVRNRDCNVEGEMEFGIGSEMENRKWKMESGKWKISRMVVKRMERYVEGSTA